MTVKCEFGFATSTAPESVFLNRIPRLQAELDIHLLADPLQDVVLSVDL
jgi:hypothetical protein